MLYYVLEVKNVKQSKIAKIIEILFKILLIGGIICIPFIPKLYDLLKIFNSFNSQTTFYKIMFYICYLLCLGILFTLNYIFKNIYKQSPFNKNIEKSLKIVAILFMSLSLVVLLKTIFIPTVLSIAVIIVTFITSLCFYTLSQIFKVAIEYKDEVDHTV